MPSALKWVVEFSEILEKELVDSVHHQADTDLKM
jgi:hypothetical protein